MQFRWVSVLVVAALVAACGPGMVNFGGLATDARSLKVSNNVRLLELSNGMRVALVPDKRTNLVSVDVRYLAGGSQDPVDRAGMAHLVEHLTFTMPGDSNGASLFDKLAALTLTFNGYTNHDVTHYTSTALAPRINALLELEARRMEASCDAISDAAFTRERDIVLAEDAQRSSGWAVGFAAAERAVWGADHPYGRGVGTREVAAATKAEACAFYTDHYAPDRAIMVVVGNFDPDALQPQIGRRFGPIAKQARAALTRPLAVTPHGTSSIHVANIERHTAMIYFPAPAVDAVDEAKHDALLMLMGIELAELDRKTSWIKDIDLGYAGEGYRRATLVVVEVETTAQVEDAAALVVRAAREILQDDDRDGNADDSDDPDDRDVSELLARVRGRQQTATITRDDRFTDKGQRMADYLTYAEHTEFVVAHLRATDAITGNGLVAYAKEIFDPAHMHVATIAPSGKPAVGVRTRVAVSEQEYDLPAWRTEVNPADAERAEALPKGQTPLTIDEFQLSNGLRVLMYAEPTSPTFDARVVFPAGALDEGTGPRGVATLAAVLLDHDYSRGYPAPVYEKLTWALRLGTQLGASVDERVTELTSRGLATFSDWHLWRLAWLLDQGVYTSADLKNVKAGILDVPLEVQPTELAIRQHLFGPTHPYARAPESDALQAITTAKLDGWRHRRLSPDGATLILAGGFDPVAMRRHVLALFGPLAKRTAAPHEPVPQPSPAAGPSWIGTRDRSAAQVTLGVRFLAASDASRHRAARAVLAEIIGDRLRVVRESMGASYGVGSSYDVGAAGSVLAIEAALDPDRAVRAATTVMAELTALRSAIPAADFVRARRRLVSDALATSTDAQTVARNLARVVRDGGALAELDAWASQVSTLTVADVAAVAAVDLDPTRMVVVVEGQEDRAKATLDALGAKDVSWFSE